MQQDCAKPERGLALWCKLLRDIKQTRFVNETERETETWDRKKGERWIQNVKDGLYLLQNVCLTGGGEYGLFTNISIVHMWLFCLIPATAWCNSNLCLIPNCLFYFYSIWTLEQQMFASITTRHCVYLKSQVAVRTRLPVLCITWCRSAGKGTL